MAEMSQAQRLLLIYLLWELQKPRIVQQITQPYRGGGGISDHGDLNGLGDDDHTQYVPVDGVARQLADAGYPNALLLDGSRFPTADVIPATDGLFLGETTTPRRWDGSKLINLPTPTGTIKTTLSFAVTGTLTTGEDKAPILLAPCTLTITKVKLVVKTAPTGATIIVDVNKNGTTIFTTQANRPQIAIGFLVGDSGTPDITSLVEGDKLTIDIDQIGSTIAGANLTVEVVTNQAVVFT